MNLVRSLIALINSITSSASSTKISTKYFIIFSDGWADRRDVTTSYEEEAWGGFSIRIHSPYVYDFDPYYWALKPSTNLRNPWFKELWESRFNCSLNHSSTDLALNASQPHCTGKTKNKAHLKFMNELRNTAWIFD